MSLEDDFIAVAKTLCPRFFPDTAPFETQAPYGIWQHVGGESLRYMDNTAADKRNAFVQITIWAQSRLQASTLLRGIEDALCSAPTLQASPQGEQVAAYDDANALRGAVQTFSIWGSR